MVDFLTSLNKYGSGMNVTQIAQDLAKAETASRRSMIEKNIESAEVSVSALGDLRNELEVLDETLAIAAQGRGKTALSSDSAIDVEISDYAALGIKSTLVDVTQIAKPQILEFGGIASVEDTVGIGVMTIEFGTWESDGSFTVNSAVAGSSVTTTQSTKMSDLAALLNSVDGLDANLVDVGDGTFSLGLTTQTGVANAVRISVAPDASYGVGETILLSEFDTATTNTAKEVQAAQNALLSVNGIAITRESNTIDDAIDGITLSLRDVTTSPAQINVENDADTALTFMAGFVDQTNLALTKLKDLTMRGLNGASPGDLVGDPVIAGLERELKQILNDPIYGYGDKAVYMSDLGVETRRDGSLYLDAEKFKTAYLADPMKYEAMLRDNLSASHSQVSLKGTPSASSQIGAFDFERNTGTGAASLDGIGLTLLENNGTRSTYAAFSGALSGVTFDVSNDVTESTVYFGRSKITQIRDALDEVLSSTGTMVRREQDFSAIITEQSENLDVLDRRQTAVYNRYITQFSAMEVAISQLNSTGEYLTNLVAQWNKDS